MALAVDTEGLHPTTEACLEMLQWLQAGSQQGFSNILDMGCGNGILSLTAASIWDARVLAVDISEKAVADAKQSIDKYDLNQQITAIRSDGFQHPGIKAAAPYDLIICNMLAPLLLSFARDIKKCSMTRGYIITSGVMSWQLAETEAVYAGLGFELLRKTEVSPWHTLAWRHTADI